MVWKNMCYGILSFPMERMSQKKYRTNDSSDNHNVQLTFDIKTSKVK